MGAPPSPPDPVMVLGGNYGAVTALTFEDPTEMEAALFSGHLNGKIVHWCLNRQRNVHGWDAHSSSVLWIALSRSGQFLFSQGRDGLVKIWVSVGEHQWRDIAKISSATLTFCNSSLSQVDSDLYLTVPTDQTSSVNVHHLPPGKLNERGLSNITHKSLQPNPTQNYGMCMRLQAFHPKDGPRLIVGYESGVIVLWDLLKGALLNEFRLYTDPVMCLTVWPASCSQTQISQEVARGVAGSANTKLISFQIQGDQLVKDRSVTVTNAGFNDVAVRHDGRIVVTGGWDSAGRVFTLSKLKPLAVLTYHRQSVQCVAFTSDNILVLGGKDGYITLWDVYKNQ